ncbi:hypothetical protein CB0940_05228 [Cercospora beticola]|uniref:Fe2OG dioxygenase domain-containing protein n=1 Tax=Cercospora beticola TaxID=122368 RepID=A0A2G5HLR3_CERBT|nr:hypothetical protein CB0940_05228 [Cercospora beticola]PIA93152.1 hypothetical protein CB0940_05228 [Cercospora beticola]WPB02547.1 hypothetical protein RHO25_007183 [Cercospora beticola]
MYMPLGRHDPRRHPPGFDSPEVIRAMAEADRRAIEGAAKAQQKAQRAAQEAARIEQEKAALRPAVTLDAGRERKKLAKKPHESSLRDLSEALQKQSRKALFTCGGQVSNPQDAHNTHNDRLVPSSGSKAVATKPVSIRWGADERGRTISLPITWPSDQAAYQQLIEDCVPATFGRNGQDVYDESYRRAGALGTEHFMTDFCPYKAGIIDSVAQLLLPPFTGDLRSDKDMSEKRLARGIRAELYKLNVYSGPSGMFKPHVDTPRSSSQIGSLVVCLPTAFSGGALAVRHQGHEIVHDWSSSSSSNDNDNAQQTAPSIHWAAFYSDCEHEVLPVTSGHRLTLTYNLFLAPGTGLLAFGRISPPQLLDPKSLPLTKHLNSLLGVPTFLPTGGFLGIHLIHAYPHTHKDLHAFVPNMLKGADMAIYESVTACNLHARLGPLRLLDGLVEPDLLRELEATKYHNNNSDNNKKNKKYRIEAHFSELQLANDEGYEMEEGRELDEVPTDSSGSEGDPLEEEYGSLSGKHLEHREAKRWNRMVVWVNGNLEWNDGGDGSGGGGGVNREVGRVYMAYGNQAELGIKYSSVAMVVRVPSWEERVKKGFGEVEEKMEEDVIVLDE